ncbi:hypothetical protein [Parabacteroides bouchesdurhonensis]|uniref:hypothetical protein n=1 Tax=Parabacteroides bouchesdurhonensis TaxID=1936995 RepID=UPI000C84CA8F|nr:hypothetical protein [Parabacteroides bouchesdurhonensis]
MKQISTILLTLAALWLSGCSVEELEQNNGNPLPGGVTRLSAAIAMGAQTRAVGDKLTDATDNEKRIDRLAFVVHTEAEGMQVYPPLKTGEDEKDFPNKVKLTNNGDGSYSAPTAIEVTGTFRGKPVTRQIPFEVLQADGLTRKAVLIVRNHRYLVLIKPAPGLTDIAYEVKVDDWNAVDTINVQPDQTLLPVYTAYECAAATKTYGIIPDTKPMPDTIVVPSTGATIKFTASCPFDTRITLGYASAEDGNGWLTATAPVLVPTTKATTEPTYQREYTVTVSANTLDATLVNRGYIYVANGGNGSAVDTITVYQGADIAYADTRFAAVTLGSLDGKELVWAPINVGATEIATDIDDLGTSEVYSYSEEVIAKIFPQCGYFYQWGRNVPFKFGTKLNGGPVLEDNLPAYAEACQNTGEYANIYIYCGNAWFKDYPSSTGGLSPLLTDKKWPREYQPCPAGWHVPSKDEWMVLAKVNPIASKGVYIYDGKLSMPKVGSCFATKWSSGGRDFVYWSSTISDDIYPYSIYNASSASKTWPVSSALPVRCVKDYE